MSSLIVEGGHRLKGTITPQGAKNEALEIICATLLTPEKVTVCNIPDIADIRNLISLLEDLGVRTEHIDSHTVSFEASSINLSYMNTEEFGRNSEPNLIMKVKTNAITSLLRAASKDATCSLTKPQ